MCIINIEWFGSMCKKIPVLVINILVELIFPLVLMCSVFCSLEEADTYRRKEKNKTSLFMYGIIEVFLLSFNVKEKVILKVIKINDVVHS